MLPAFGRERMSRGISSLSSVFVLRVCAIANDMAYMVVSWERMFVRAHVSAYARVQCAGAGAIIHSRKICFFDQFASSYNLLNTKCLLLQKCFYCK